MKNIIYSLLPDLPQVVLRCKVGLYTQAAVSPRTLANHDARTPPTGPRERFLINGKVAYTRESFLEWLAARSRIVGKVTKPASKADAFLHDDSPATNQHHDGDAI